MKYKVLRGCTVPFRSMYVLICSLLSALVLAALVTCSNPFDTRQPEPPQDLRSSWFQPVSPETVIDNFVSAVREKNIDNYIRCFGNSEALRRQFRFLPEQSVANHYQGLFMNWTITEERNYISQLFGQLPQDSLSSLTLTTVTEFQFGDSVKTMKDYEFFASHTNTAVERHVSGRMELTLKKGIDALWYISYWADYKTGDAPVWSILKAEF